MKRTQPHCSIVIRAYNEEKHIGRLLTGISQQTRKDIEVILVDSGSTDATVAIAMAFSGDLPLHLVRIKPETFSFGYSLNQGIARAQGEMVVIASAHIYPVFPDWLERLSHPFADPQVGLVYGKQRGNARTQFSERQIFSHWYPDVSQSRQATPFCNNANAAIRRSLWEQRKYDESLPGLEDLDWARWAIEQGYAVSYTSEAEVIHVHEETLKGVYNRYRREAMAFKRIFPQERFNFGDFLRLAIANIASDLWHALRQHVLWSNLGSIFWFRLMQFWGTYQGYRQSGPLTWQLRQTFFYPRSLALETPPVKRNLPPIRYNETEET